MITKLKYFCTQHWGKILTYSLLSLIVYLILLAHLEDLPLRQWDESRLATNTYEMLQNGNYLIPHFNRTPDMWNTKPPLMIWCQALFVKIFGANDLSLRLPSALSAVLTCILLVVFSKKHLNSHVAGIVSVLVLLTSQGYVNMHGARSADYDAMLTLFVFAYSLSYYAYLSTHKTKYLTIFFISLIAASLTKGITAIVILPGLLIITIIDKQLGIVLKNPKIYIGIASWIFIILGYYLVREHYNPGYLKAVYENELGGRFLTTLEDHKAPFQYYFEEMINERFEYWYALVPCGVLLCIYDKPNYSKTTQYMFILSLWFLWIISMAETKLWWYAMPIYPFCALLGGIFISKLLNTLNSLVQKLQPKEPPLYGMILIFLVFQAPCRKMIKACFSPYQDAALYYAIPRYIKNHATQTNFDNKIILSSSLHYNQSLIAYYNQLQYQGKNIIHKDLQELKVGDVIINSDLQIKKHLEASYNIAITNQKENVEELILISKK